jgi:hypothetical protein
MRPSLPLALATILTLALAGCGVGGARYSYEDVTITVSPSIASLPVNATQQFTSTTTNAPNTPFWSATAGTVTQTGLYTAPATPPVYTQDQLAKGSIQGRDIVSAGTFYSIGGSLTFATASGTQTFAITAPSITAGITPATATVPLGTTEQFTPFAVGNINNAYTLQVGGVTGGSTSLGTISSTGLYTAPTAMPMTGPTVTITVISQADPTKTATATITLQ